MNSLLLRHAIFLSPTGDKLGVQHCSRWAELVLTCRVGWEAAWMLVVDESHTDIGLYGFVAALTCGVPQRSCSLELTHR